MDVDPPDHARRGRSCNRRRDTAEADAKHKVAIKRLRIQRGKRNIVVNHDVGELPCCQRAARLVKQAITYGAVVPEQDLAGFDKRERGVSVFGTLVQVHGSRLRYQVR